MNRLPLPGQQQVMAGGHNLLQHFRIYSIIMALPYNINISLLPISHSGSATSVTAQPSNHSLSYQQYLSIQQPLLQFPDPRFWNSSMPIPQLPHVSWL